MRLLPFVVLASAGLVARAAQAQPPTSPLPPPTTTAPPPATAPSPTTAPPLPPATAPAPTPAPAGPLPPTSPPAAPGSPPASPPVYAPPPPGYYPPPYYQPARPSLPPADAHSHSGFFLRMALGAGRMVDSTSIEGGTYAGGLHAAGGAFDLELDIGGAISRGFILAGSFTGSFLNDPKLTDDTRRLRPERRSQLTMLALMGDVYPVPTGGFHVGGALGFASLQVRHGDTQVDSQDQSGFGFSGHVGYEWWVANYWGLGALGRVFYAHTKGDYGGGTATDKLSGFALCFSATYN